MAIKIAQLLVGISADTKQLKKKLDQSRKDFSNFTGAIKKLGGALAVAFSVRTVITGITRTVSEVDKLAKSFRLLGIQIKDLGKLEVLSAEGSVGLNQVVIGLQRQVRRISEAAKGTGESRGALSELGFFGGRGGALERLAALDPVAQLTSIAKAMEGITTQADKVRIGFKLWDSEGVRPMLELMRGGEASFLAAAQSAKKLGLAITPQDTKNMEAFSTALARLTLAGKGAFRTLTIAIAPAAIRAIQILENVVASSRAQPDESTLRGRVNKLVSDAFVSSPGGRAFGFNPNFVGPSIQPGERLANRPGLQKDISRLKAAQARAPATGAALLERQDMRSRFIAPFRQAGQVGLNFGLNAIQSLSSGLEVAVRGTAPFARRDVMFGRFANMLAEIKASPKGGNVLAPNRAIFGDTTSGFSALRENLRRVESANERRDVLLTRILEVLREARGELQQAEIF